MSLVDTYPERFGWKYWNLAVDHGLLVSPHKQLSFSGPRIDARCIHGNVAPSTECQCGIHYVPRFSDIDRWTKCSTQSTGPYGRVAVTFGAAVGDILPDTCGTYAEIAAGSLRTSKYLVLAILVGEHEAMATRSMLRTNHQCPVFAGHSATLRDAIVDNLVPDCGPGWFTVQAERATTPPSKLVRQLNASGIWIQQMKEAVRGLRPPASPKPTPTPAEARA